MYERRGPTAQRACIAVDPGAGARGGHTDEVVDVEARQQIQPAEQAHAAPGEQVLVGPTSPPPVSSAGERERFVGCQPLVGCRPLVERRPLVGRGPGAVEETAARLLGQETHELVGGLVGCGGVDGFDHVEELAAVTAGSHDD